MIAAERLLPATRFAAMKLLESWRAEIEEKKLSADSIAKKLTETLNTKVSVYSARTMLKAVGFQTHRQRSYGNCAAKAGRRFDELEARVAELERELAGLKQSLQGRAA